MASGTSSGQKRNSFHRFSQSILHPASPSFSRGSFDAPSLTPRKRTFTSRPSVGASSLTLSETRDSQSVYNPTATFTSAADSQTTSSPLLPPTPQSPVHSPNLPVPPTTNDLSEEEKLRLMWKVRKLSRVLGEIPVSKEPIPSSSAPERIDELEELPSPPRPSTPLPTSIRSASASAKKAFRRSLTFGQNGALPPMLDVHRAKSLSTLRPSLNIVVGSHSDVPTPSVSPMTFAWPEGEGPSSEVPASARSAPESLNTDLRDVSEPRMKRRNSTASSILLADQNTEQVQWARAAKLSRHFGTTIPPEVLRRAASPPLRTPSPDASFGRVYQSDELPKRSASLRGKTRATRHQRPLSLDLRDRSSRDAANPGSTSTPSSPPGDNFQTVGSLRRSKSLWTQGAAKDETEQYTARDGGFSLDGGSVAHEPLSEKQRALNVKRARKMAQLFGDNPPTALFQITNFKSASTVQLAEDSNSVGHGSADGHHRFERDSLATIISISTSSTLSKIRDSYLSVVTTSSEVSGMLLEGVDDADAQVISADVSPQPTMLPIAQPRPRRSRSNIRPSTSPGPSRPASPLEQLSVPSSATHPPRTPPTPPPFSDLIESEPPRPATAPPIAAPDFQNRRRRAAKLSKFFGVEVKQLADVLPTDQSAPLSSRKASLASGEASIDTVPAVPFGESSIVIDGRKRGFLGFDNDTKELDMNDAIDKLRRMKV